MKEFIGHEWAAFKLGVAGIIKVIVVDTNHFMGNFPDSISIEAVEDGVNESDTSLEPPKSWPIAILGSQKLGPNRHHYFVDQFIDHSKLSHVKVMIKPDGGISRIRLLGIV